MLDFIVSDAGFETTLSRSREKAELLDKLVREVRLHEERVEIDLEANPVSLSPHYQLVVRPNSRRIASFPMETWWSFSF